MKPTPPTFSHLASRSGRITQMRLGPRLSPAIGSLTPGGSDIRDDFQIVRGEYAYDSNGNLVCDRNACISDIDYNPVNLPRETVYTGQGTATPFALTTYDAAGRKHALIQGYRDSKGAVTSADTTLYIGNFLVVNGKVDRVTTPYGYLRGGKFHTFIRDYQGSVVCVATADGVVQATTYYPDGLPQSNSTGIHNNKQKHLAKELDFFQGANYYDYTARYAVPARGLTFNSIDRRAEDYRHLSPYSSNAGDPINNIDPTGEKFEIIELDAGSFNEANLIFEQYFDNAYSLSLEDGFVSIIVNDANYKLSPEQTECLKAFYKIVNDEQTTTVNLGNDIGVPIGNADNATVDINDIKTVGNGDYVSSITCMFHEFYEQYLIQAKKIEKSKAHIRASYGEGLVSGFVLDHNRPIDYDECQMIMNVFDKTYTDKEKQPIGQVVFFFDSHFRITKVERRKF